MRITQIDIENFRAFQKPFNMHLSPNLTAISGQNGIGKSTILAILANTSELKRELGHHLNGSTFRGEFSDLIIYDPDFDTSGDKVNVHFKDIPDKPNYVPSLTYRASAQKNTTIRTSYKLYKRKIISETFYPNGKSRKHWKNYFVKESTVPDFKRYRLIPKSVQNKENNQKLSWPVYYLGLSRLYPAGEDSAAKMNRFNISSKIEKDILNIHQHILGENFDKSNSSFENVKLEDFKKAKTGIKTRNFSATSNSSGQDNLGQILLTIKSFELLKEKQGANYIGGLLLIDEIDATLHPAAQQRLIEYLYEESIKLQLQIVFTTHSYTLLAYLKNYRKSKITKENRDSILVNYLTASYDIDGLVKCTENPESSWMKLNLTDELLPNQKELFKKVLVFTEDSRARWLINKMIAHSSNKKDLEAIHFADVSMPWNSLANLAKESLSILPKSIFIFDPDLSEKKAELIETISGDFNQQSEALQINSTTGRIFILPGTFAIEKVLWDFVSSLNSEDEFYKIPKIVNANLGKNILLQKCPQHLEDKKLNDTISKFEKDNPKKSLKSLSSQTDKYKLWASEMGELLDIICDYWIKCNRKDVNTFTDTLFKSVLHLD
ncbi:ATP-dependent nuclease [Lactiplantibacillus plantarum]|uniref:ATP-dependent nuclease n=1 Tax=Lactiplantibacillus plantarum TaxID=1590 RepID=UPI0032DE89B5